MVSSRGNGRNRRAAEGMEGIGEEQREEREYVRSIGQRGYRRGEEERVEIGKQQSGRKR
jgi:hypothetical protein